MAAQQLRSIYQVKVTLAGSKPPIWRTILIPSTITLEDFHTVLQIGMGWTDSHLHQFVSGRDIYGTPDSDFDLDFEIKDERKYKISHCLKKEKDKLIYEYDFGDGWEHKIVLDRILPFDKSVPLPRCMKGKRNCPPEDCGGIWGYQDLLEILQDPTHPEHEEMIEWLGEEFDPDYFDIKEINALFAEFCS